MYNLFLGDIKQELGSLLEIRYSGIKFSDYKTKTLPKLVNGVIEGHDIIEEDVEIIEGVLPVFKNNQPTLKVYSHILDVWHESILDKETFFDILSLAKNIDIKARFGSHNIEAIPTNEIIELFKKYGMSASDISYDGPIWRQYNIYGINLRSFKYRLFTLHWRFSVYMALCYEDCDLLREIVPSSLLPDGKKSSNKQLLETAADWLIQETRAGVDLSLKLNKELFSLSFEASDIISASNIFLMLLIITGDGNNLKVCANPKCQQVFLGHGNRKYCHNCNRKTVWSRNARAAD